MNGYHSLKRSTQLPLLVALCVDRDYAVAAAVTIASLAANLPKHTRLKIWVLHSGLETEQLNLISTAADRYKASLHEYKIPADQLDLPVMSDYISAATFGRLYLGHILPSEYQRVLYLDSDVLVTGDVSELWNVNLNNQIVGAVLEPNMGALKNPKTYERLCDPRIDPSMPYFNAGVLLIDLVQWRLANVGDRAVRYIRRYRPVLMDQDALNAVIAGRWLQLDPMWNLTTFWFRSRTRQRRFQALLSRARIIHNVGHRKPWLRKDVWAGERWSAYLHELFPDRVVS